MIIVHCAENNASMRIIEVDDRQDGYYSVVLREDDGKTISIATTNYKDVAIEVAHNSIRKDECWSCFCSSC